MPKLGETVKDKVTGFKGIVTGACQYISGCEQFLVQPVVKENGDFVDARWVDIDRLDHVYAETVELEITKPGFDKSAPVK